MAAKLIRQRTSAGNDLDGTAPTGPPESQDDDKTIYPIEEAGGEFAPGAVTLLQVTLRTGGHDWWCVKIAHADASETILGHKNDPEPVHKLRGPWEIAADDKIVVETKDAHGPVTCDVLYE
jgi:hypothetical protein